MATVVDVDRLVSITEAPSYLKPYRGKCLHPDTLKRWATRGFRGCDTKLRIRKIGHQWLVSLDDLREFVDAMGCAQMIG